MTQNKKKNTYIWTEKHLKFSLKYRLSGICQTLWKWFLILGDEGSTVEFNLNEFQEYVENLRGKSHTFRLVKEYFEKLVFLRIINIDKDFGHNTYRIELRHPDATIPKKRYEKNLHYHQVSVEKQPSNDCQPEQDLYSSSLDTIDKELPANTDNVLSIDCDVKPEETRPTDNKENKRRFQIIQICAKYGVHFNPKKRTTEELYKYPIEEITESLQLFKFRNKGAAIINPQGWLIDCLRYRFFDDLQYSIENFIADVQEVFHDVLKTT